MERAASALGSRFAVPEIVVGGLVLAAVTSLPNAVAAVYLAARGRGAATLSTALNSNTLNVVVGLLIPRGSDRAGPGEAKIAADLDSADLSGVSGTPTFFINGKRHHGAYDIATLSDAVRSAGTQALISSGRRPQHTS